MGSGWGPRLAVETGRKVPRSVGAVWRGVAVDAAARTVLTRGGVERGAPETIKMPQAYGVLGWPCFLLQIWLGRLASITHVLRAAGLSGLDLCPFALLTVFVRSEEGQGVGKVPPLRLLNLSSGSARCGLSPRP